MAREAWTLQQLLSPARMAPYLSATDNEWQLAVALYDWNTAVSAAFFESFHYLEVGLRNAIDQSVSSVVGSAWLTSAPPVLTPRSQRVVATAVDHAGGPTAAHGKVVAELPFGFWWSLFADESNRRLWQPALQFAFEGGVRRRRLHRDLGELGLLRNRIAHHEPIHHRNLDLDFARVVDIASRVGFELRQHIVETSRVPSVLVTRN